MGAELEGAYAGPAIIVVRQGENGRSGLRRVAFRRGEEGQVGGVARVDGEQDQVWLLVARQVGNPLWRL